MYLKAQVIGRIGQKPVMRTTQGGANFLTLSVACTLYRGKEKGKETQWIDVAVWNERQAEFLEQYADKGSTVMVEGEPSARHYVDKSGENRTSLSITIGRFSGDVVLMGGGESNGDEKPASKPAARKQVNDEALDDFDDGLPPGW